MPIHSPEFDLVTAALALPLAELSPRVIAITGTLCSGKTTLARYLAWFFNISLIETDLFLISGPPLKYRNEEVERIILFRLNLRRPVIVEGVKVQDLLSQLGRTPDFLIKVTKLASLQSGVIPSLSSAFSATVNESCTTFEIVLHH